MTEAPSRERLRRISITQFLSSHRRSLIVLMIIAICSTVATFEFLTNYPAITTVRINPLIFLR